jgi:glycine/D-amino acid oxidase-like deaminating enzyme
MVSHAQTWHNPISYIKSTYQSLCVRIGGHLRPDIYSATALFTERHGLEAAAEVVRFEISHLKLLEELVRKEKIDCELTFTRSYDMYLDEDQLKKAKAFYDLLVAQGFDFMDDVNYMAQSDTQKVRANIFAVDLLFDIDHKLPKTAHVRDAKGGFSFPTGHLWPYKLVTSLVNIAVSHGLDLQTHTPVSEISDTPTADGLWSVTTSRGVIKARKIIFATNAFTSALAPQYERAIVPCKGVCTQIAAAPGAPHQELPGTYAIRLGPNAYIYQITRNDGTIIAGGASHTFRDDTEQWYNNPDDGKLIDVGVDFFDGYMQRTFLGWADSGAEVKHVWTGGTCTLPVAAIANLR